VPRSSMKRHHNLPAHRVRLIGREQDLPVVRQALLASRWAITGTHRGTFQGVPATGRLVNFSGIDFSRVVDGKVAEHWAQFDLVAVLQQIGAVPATAQA